MFGGLSVKGDSKEETPSAAAAAAAAPVSSGFGFLQPTIGSAPQAPTPAPEPTADASSSSVSVASTDNAVAGDPPASLSGSAFGFMSGSGISSSVASVASSNSNAPTQAQETSAATAAAPSMFAGLTTSSSSASKEAVEPAAVAETSGSGGGGGLSGFSFMSTAPAPVVPETAASEATTINATTAVAAADAASTTSTAGSNFSFMNSMASSSMAGSSEHGGGDDIAKMENLGESLPAVEEKSEAFESTTPATSTLGGGGLSGFSFMSGATSASTAPAAPPPAPDNLEQPPAPPPSLIPETPATPAAPAPAVDLMSMPSPAALPTGSGVSWSAPPGMAGTKKVVKKKRGKRVGVGSSSAAAAPPPQQQTNAIADPSSSQTSFIPEPQFQPPQPPPTPSTPQIMTMSSPSPYSTQTPTRPGENAPIQQPVLPDSPPMRIKAERAMDKAEEFILQKQQQAEAQKSALALAAERAMQDKNGDMQRSPSVESSGSSGWKMNINATTEPTSPRDETYQAAKAAAEEAMKLEHTHQPKGKASLFGGFFGRGKNSSGGGKDGHHMPSQSSHGGVVASPAFQRGNSNGSTSVSGGASLSHSPLPPTKETLNIASYGSPRAMNDDEQNQHDVSANNPAMDAEKQRQMELAQHQKMELERQHQREAAAEQRRKEEERQLEIERQRKLEEERFEAERLLRRSPREKMQSILDHLADATRTSTDAVTKLREERAILVKQKSEAEKAERYADQQLKLTEAQQMLAAEEEDFEAADRLASVIDKHSVEKEAQSKVVAEITTSIEKLDKEKDLASKAVSACFAEVHSQLQTLENEVDDRSKEAGVLSQFATTSKRLSSETERLANDLKHIERDEEVLAEEQKESSAQISEETKEFEEECKLASSSLEEVNVKIEELRKQLAEAESKAAELNSEIASYNQSVQTIKSKYSRQLGRLEKKEKSVTESRADWESEKDSIEKAKAAHEAVVAAHSEDMLTRETLIEDIKAESTTAKDFEEIVSSAFAASAVRNGEGSPSLDGVDSEVLKYEAAVNEANQNMIAAEANIASLKEELSAIEMRVPILEDLKKSAAAKRDFKAAGKASKEIKDSLARKEQCQSELAGEAMEREQFAKDDLTKITVLLEEKKSIAAKKGKEAGMKQMEMLWEKIDHLKSILKKFASGSSVGAKEDTINVSCVGAFVIETQIDVLETEGKALGDKYGGWESLSDVVEDSSVHSAPSFGSDQDSTDIVIDESVLKNYISLRNDMSTLDVAIEEAAEKEDYEKAAELEEEAQKVREEFEATGFSSKKFELALKEFTDKSMEDDTGNDESAEKVIDQNVLDEYSSLCAAIKELESDIEATVEDEDYDRAAELEKKIISARSNIDSLGFSTDELDEALKQASHAKEDNVDEEDTPDGDEEGSGSTNDEDSINDKCTEEETEVDKVPSEKNDNEDETNGESAPTVEDTSKD